MNERVQIQFLLEQGFKVRAIVRTLNRDAATISRELARNRWLNPARPRGRGRPPKAGGYRAVAAQERAVGQAPQAASSAARHLALGADAGAAGRRSLPRENQRHTAAHVSR